MYLARIDAFGLDTILDHVIDGKVLRWIAALPELNMSRAFLTNYLNGKINDKNGTLDEREARSKKRRALYAEARKMSATTIVEDGREQLDEETDPRMAQLAMNRATFRLRIAEAFDRDQYGQSKAQININLGSMHLDALRKRVVARVDVPLLENPEPDYTVEQDEPLEQEDATPLS